MAVKELILDNIGTKKLTLKGLLALTRIQTPEEEASFYVALEELERENLIRVDKKGFYQKVKQRKQITVEGKISIDNTGVGSVYTNGRKYYIKEENLNGALNGDVVLLETIQINKNGFSEAIVQKVISRDKGKAIFEYIGNGEFKEYNSHGNILMVCPKERLNNIVAGHLVTMTIGGEIAPSTYEGEVEKVVGHKDDPEIDLKAIAADHGFYAYFSKQAEEEVKQIPQTVREEETKGRVDLRDEIIFTIDGKDTKDMDDAISIKLDEDGNFILGVHIADVNHYVKEGSALDKEARERGTSLYLDNAVIPMLPHELSNGICSLNEGEDRLTKTVEMKINEDGEIIDYKIYDSVIRSRKKMTYEEVNKILEDDEEVEGYEDFEPYLLLMWLLSEKITEQRRQRGNIEFAGDELKIKKDENGISFEDRTQRAGEKLIENFMILANETVTKHYALLELPFVYRVHGDPQGFKIAASLRKLMENGLCGSDAKALINKIKGGNYSPKDIGTFLERYKGTDKYPLISKMLLTSMTRARYSEVNEGHYGLALDYYTHFTSPIRRYPDLEVHRLIDRYKTQKNEDLENLESQIHSICEHSSEMEREADQAERETLELRMAEYGLENLGKEFRGQVVGQNQNGVMVKLDSHAKGIIPNDDLGPRKRYRIGEKVVVLIKEVSIPHRVILLEPKYKKKKTKGKVKTRRGRR